MMSHRDLARRRRRTRRRIAAVALVALAAVVLVGGWIGVRDLRRGYYTVRGASVVRFTVTSPLVHRDLHEILVVPPGGGRGRELLVFLHGRSSYPAKNLRQPFFDALHDLGSRIRAAPGS